MTAIISTILETASVPAEEVLRGDERLLESGGPAVRAGRFSDWALSLGVSQNLADPVARQARALGIPVIRRSSGGLAVLHAPGDLFFSLIVPRATGPGWSGVRDYARWGEGVVRALAERGVDAGWAIPAGVSVEHCLLGPRGWTLQVMGRTLAGASQHMTRRALLHHGIVIRHLDLSRHARVFQMSRDVLREHLISLEDLPAPASELTPSELLEHLRRSLERALPPSSGQFHPVPR